MDVLPQSPNALTTLIRLYICNLQSTGPPSRGCAVTEMKFEQVESDSTEFRNMHYRSYQTRECF